MNLHQRRSGYRPEIDGLRALAVAAVIVNHFDHALLPGGYLGVDIFFVISGYVITSVLVRSRHQTFGDFILEFYKRRIKRLVPALVLCCVSTGLMLCLFNPEPGGSLSTGINALLGFSNIALYRQAVDYFGPATEFNPFTQTWSLGVEEQFYLLFPSLFWLAGMGRLKAGGSRQLLLWVLALSVVSLSAFVDQQGTNQPAAYFLMHARFWELGFGCLVFLVARRAAEAPTISGNLLAILALASIVAILFVPLAYTVPATISVVMAAGLLIATMGPGTIAHRLLTYRPIVYVGLISYSLYLWHWSVLALSRWTVGVHGWYVPVEVVLILGLAGASYHLVEAPLREAAWSSRRWVTISYGTAATVFGVALLLILAKPWFGEPLSSRLYAGTIPEMQKSYRKLKKSAAGLASCNLFEAGSVATHLAVECGAGEEATKPTVYLLGDSHIFQFNAAIARYALERGYNYRSVWGNSCVFPAAKLYGEDSECYRLQHVVQASLFEQIKPGDILFIGNALYARFSGLWDDDRGDPARPLLLESLAKDYSASLKDVADQLVAQGVRVVVYLDGPQFVDFRGSEHCEEQWFVRHPPKECFLGEREFLYQRDRLFGWLRDWAGGPLRFVCDGVDENTCSNGVCRATHYHDSNHVKGYYAAYLFDKFVQEHPEFGSRAGPGDAATPRIADAQHRHGR